MLTGVPFDLLVNLTDMQEHERLNRQALEAGRHVWSEKPMANSLEVRCPLLDHEMGEFAASVPTAWKMKNGRGKSILIDAMADRLPPALLTRPKMGFGVPLHHWFRTSLRDFLRDHLTSRRFRERGFTQPAFLEAILQEHQSGRRDNSLWLWSLLMLELWMLGWRNR